MTKFERLVKKKTAPDTDKQAERLLQDGTLQQLVASLTWITKEINSLDKRKKHIFYGSEKPYPTKDDVEYPEVTHEFLSDPDKVKALHAVIGMATEVGELFECIIPALAGGDFDKVNFKEELGDVKFYCTMGSLAMDTNDSTIEQLCMDKLNKRYTDGFSKEEAETRDLDAERKILEK